jgi:hypothetical protein
LRGVDAKDYDVGIFDGGYVVVSRDTQVLVLREEIFKSFFGMLALDAGDELGDAP